MAHIHVIDDENTMRQLVQHILGSRGYDVHLWASPEEFLKAAPQQIDTVLTDLLLPHMDGFHLCAELRNRADTREVPIVVMTGLNWGEAVEAQLRSKYAVSSLVHKPFSGDALFKVIARVAGSPPIAVPV